MRRKYIIIHKYVFCTFKYVHNIIPSRSLLESSFFLNIHILVRLHAFVVILVITYPCFILCVALQEDHYISAQMYM